MPLPTVTVEATFIGADEEPLAGQVEFTPSAPMQDPDGNVIVDRRTIVASVDPDTGQLVDPQTGEPGVELIATDFPGVQPEDVTYIVQKRLHGVRSAPYAIPVPTDSPGGVLDLADVAPLSLTPMFGYALLSGDNIWTGDQTFDGDGHWTGAGTFDGDLTVNGTLYGVDFADLPLDIARTGVANAWTAAQDHEDDVFFGSGKPWIDPRSGAFGAVGDGAADDQVPVQNAANAAAALAVDVDGAILLIDAFYAMNQLAPDDGVEVRGKGKLIKRLGAAGTNNALLYLDGKEDVWIEGITVDCQNLVLPYTGPSVTQRSCIGIRNQCRRVTVHRVKIVNAGRDGINIYWNGGTSSPEEITVSRCRITDCTRWGIALTDGAHISIDRNYIEGGGLGSIDLEPNGNQYLQDVAIERNRILPGNTTSGQISVTLGAGAGGGGPYQDIYIRGNYVEGVPNLPNSLIRMAGFLNPEATDNTVKGAAESAISATGSTGATIHNNRILASTGLAAITSVTNGSIFVTGRDVAVTDNLIQGSFWNGVTLSNTDNCIVKDNRIFDVGQIRPTLGGSWYGVYVYNSRDADVDDNEIADRQVVKTMQSGVLTRESGVDAPCTGNWIGLGNTVRGSIGVPYSINAAHCRGIGRLVQNPGAIAAGASFVFVVTVKGVKAFSAGQVMPPVVVNLEAPPAGLVMANAWSSADDAVSVRVTNVTAAAINPGNTTVHVQALRV